MESQGFGPGGGGLTVHPRPKWPRGGEALRASPNLKKRRFFRPHFRHFLLSTFDHLLLFWQALVATVIFPPLALVAEVVGDRS